MSWVVKRGRWEYVFAGPVGIGRPVEWTDDQALAHRFEDRNYAAYLVGRMPATDADVRVVRLRTRSEP